MKVSNDFVYQFCPFCGNEIIEKVGEIEYGKPVLFSSNTIELLYPAFLMKCKHCRSGFTQYAVQNIDLIDLYSNSNSGNRWSNAVLEKNKSSEIINVLYSYISRNSKIVDVGCNTGELLDFAKALGAKTIGIELSKKSRETLKQKEHESYESLEHLDNQSIDVITAFDLIEHLHYPNEFINLCRKKLKDSGSLILLTGNINSISAVISGSKWWYCSYPEHISFVSKKYLSNIEGFKLDLALPTYASKSYRRNFLRIIISLLIKYPFGKYRGLPSMGPDHFLYVLTKT
ncbi:MAG: hypothetical protein CL578_01115 [Alteromonadaceae bacterium]|jgi:SAM-dependent methyltransferase|uniref:class I SAM-dependent methyltransferase n=1 Tax=unclassified Methylophaga TaxID=2629249 RepID=UPI000C5DC48F|nr:MULTISPECIES: class I SAM-dependent methyltransferase [unclassified Methylophaga]MAP27034.1 hypothetical protein [Methylophaga sp.]MBN23635.1 hypothetical protein [Alteromonadaceae bacterium]HCO01216.1 hypothetical protein [Methylophaga sp.]|tara:strand:- start:7294 stop:8154 length:861 start_codon:yes stop_codon:yes gene_type:complete